MKIHCPNCQGVFRVENLDSEVEFECPFCKLEFVHKGDARVVLRETPDTEIRVESEEGPTVPTGPTPTPDPSSSLRDQETVVQDPEQIKKLKKVQTSPAKLTDLSVGDDVNGYRLDDVIGWGGMSVVFRAHQISLGRDVALKVLRKDLSQDAEFAKRFTKEAQALAELSHPNIVSVFDQGSFRGNHYLVMEYVDGVSLREILNERKLRADEALKLVPDICAGLEYAHSRGMVHRDIKPENILLDKTGTPRIADFGLVRMLGDEGNDISRLTKTQTVLGTLEYMSPEQREGKVDVDHRSDIYSLGVVLYELLTGELPIARFPLPSESVKVDVRLDEVVVKVLQKDRDRRYQRASMVASDLEGISTGQYESEQDAVRRKEIWPRLFAMNQSLPILAVTVAYVMTLLFSRDETVAFATGAVIPFYLAQFVTHGILPRMLVIRGFIYRHPIFCGIAAGIAALWLGGGDELGVFLAGLSFSGGLVGRVYRDQLFRGSLSEPRYVTAPHVAELLDQRRAKPDTSSPRVLKEEVPPVTATAQAMSPQAVAVASEQPEVKAKRMSLLVVLGFLATLLTTMVSIAGLIAVVNGETIAENIQFSYYDLRSGLPGLWQEPHVIDAMNAAVIGAPFAPLAAAAIINVFGFLALCFGRVRGKGLFSLSLLILTAQLCMAIVTAVNGDGMINRYENFKRHDSVQVVNGAGGFIDQMAYLHAQYDKHVEQVAPLEERAPIVSMALDKRLPTTTRIGALVLLQENYGERLFLNSQQAGLPENWVDRFRNLAHNSQDYQLSRAFEDTLESCQTLAPQPR